ncbi:MAG: prolipoprotein diacylglyceryl transferase [Pirellulaceae bacterium]|nr:prolipoprotein diacylglyceryl transferase [Pirellulaceae bacterium]
MRSTLFLIPAELFGLPVFGFGLLLGGWIVLSVLAMGWLVRQQGWNRDTAGYLPLLGLIAAAIVFLLPGMVEIDPATRLPLGVPVKGFGVMLMLATVAAVGLAAYRASQMGLDPEVIYSLAFCMFVAGIAGARLFYIIQYWAEFQRASLVETLQAAANVTKGGLVVYGSVLGGVPAGIWFLLHRRLPVLALLDIIAPSMVVGLALGRLGCFLNGCCYGGVCLTAPYALTFPGKSALDPPSPPYSQQLEAGWNSGLWLIRRGEEIAIGYIAPLGPAADQLRVGDVLSKINGAAVDHLLDPERLAKIDPARRTQAILEAAQERLRAAHGSYEVETADGRIVRWTTPQPPPRSVPIHPAQLYAAIDAGLLALVLWFFYPYRRRDGEVFALLLTVHPLSRFLLELIRSDEPGQFGTELTISQWLSVAFFAAGIVLWIWIASRPAGTALPAASRLATE